MHLYSLRLVKTEAEPYFAACRTSFDDVIQRLYHEGFDRDFVDAFLYASAFTGPLAGVPDTDTFEGQAYGVKVRLTRCS